MTSKTFERKLSAILSADVAGYSRLMGSDEDLTITTLTGHREMMSTLIENHNGRVIDSPGDNLLAAFASVTQAVDCAVEIQREMAERNEELPDDRKMEYRIGVNLGDVIEEGERIYGDGVNIAARLEALAEPGGICISGFVYNQVKNRLKLEYEYLGEQSVKNIKEPVPVYRILSFPGAAAHRVIEAKKTAEREKEASSFRDKPSIAVLPFVDLSREKDQEYFVDGLSEEILNSLCQIPDLTVIARTSSFSFKGKDKTIQEIASVLGVDNILEGSVRKAGNSLRITSQLVKAVDGSHLWSKTYNRELRDIFEVQEDIAAAVADELKITFGIGQSLKQLGGTDNVKAYEHFVVAQGKYARVSHPSYTIESLDAALELDPEFALAWASKAMRHIELSMHVPPNQVAAEQAAGLAAAQKAIELGPNLAEAYVALARYNAARGDFIKVESTIRKAFSLKPELMWGIGSVFVGFYLDVGHFEKAYEILDLTLQNDPLNFPYRLFLISYFSLVGDTKRAEDTYEGVRALVQDLALFNFHIFITITRLGSKDSVSIDKIPEIPILDPIWSFVRDHLDSPEDVLSELHRVYNNDVNMNVYNLWIISIWAAYFGEPNFALEVMEKEYEVDATFLNLLWAPLMREARQLPRFKEFVREIGIIDYWNEFGWPNFCHQLDNGDLEFD